MAKNITKRFIVPENKSAEIKITKKKNTQQVQTVEKKIKQTDINKD